METMTQEEKTSLIPQVRYANAYVVGFAILEDVVDLVMECTEGKIFHTLED